MIRSYLFVPGDGPERFDKAMAAGAGQVILDLEDAVAPAGKDRAREAVAAFVRADRPVALRINATGTPWFEDDLAMAASSGVAAVMVPRSQRTARCFSGPAACSAARSLFFFLPLPRRAGEGVFSVERRLPPEHSGPRRPNPTPGAHP